MDKNMKQYRLTFMLAVLLSMACNKAFAYDVMVEYQGRYIYFNFIGDGQELEVTSNPNSTGYAGDIVIPHKVTDTNTTWDVTSIGENAFHDDKWLYSVTIPNSVRSIRKSAFHGCTGLTSVTIPNSVSYIGEFAFCYCTAMKSVTIECNTATIWKWAFLNCTALESVIIGNSVKSIYIQERAFDSCNGIKKVVVNDIAAWCGISAVGDYANPLDYAHNLYRYENNEYTVITDLVIPNSVTVIYSSAFKGCTDLRTLTIGDSVRSIGSAAFYNTGLKSVISLIENPFNIPGKDTPNSIFSRSTFMNADLYVPQGTKSKYMSTEGWKDFVSIHEGLPAGVEGVKTDNEKTEMSRYSIDGKKLSKPQNGINIIKMSDGTTKKIIVKDK